jgi:cobalamin-dependent methionine synthase I
MFTVVGERINTSRKQVQKAVEERNASYIQEDVKRQQDAGANFIDVNAGARIGHEMEDMEWLLEVIQEVVTIPLCLDSPDLKVIERSVTLVQQTPMINSISLETGRYQPMLSLLSDRDLKVVALCMDDTGMPGSAIEVVERAGRLVEGLEGAGIKRENIYLDPLIQPVSTDVTKGIMAMDAIRGIMSEYPGVHTVCGLSNVSYGLPQRKFLNRIFLALLVASGLDTAIMDPLDDAIMAVLTATLTLLGKDDYCMNYIRAVRAGRIIS